MNEKETRYFNRTLEHIHRVQRNMFTLITKYNKVLQLDREDCRKLAHQVMNHDRSKFNKAQFEAYVELTEYYHQRRTLKNKEYEYPSEKIKKLVDNAIINHYHNENHHAESKGGMTSPFTDLETVEIICDLQAMAQEFDEGSCRNFFENTWQPKYDCDSSTFNGYANLVIECFERELESE